MASLDAKPSYILVTTDSVDVVCAWSLALSCTGEIMARAQCLSRGLLDRAPLPCKRHGQKSHVTQCRIETARKSAELGQFVMRNSKNGCNCKRVWVLLVLRVETENMLSDVSPSCPTVFRGKRSYAPLPATSSGCLGNPSPHSKRHRRTRGLSARLAVSFLATFVCAADTSLLMCGIKCVQM